MVVYYYLDKNVETPLCKKKKIIGKTEFCYIFLVNLGLLEYRAYYYLNKTVKQHFACFDL